MSTDERLDATATPIDGFAGTDEVADLFAAIFTASPLGMALVDEHGRMTKVNPVLCSILGRPASELEGTSFDAYVVEADDDEQRLQRPDGSAVVAEVIATPVAGGPRGVLRVRDVTEERQARDRLTRLAHHDPVTAVGNRSMAMAYLVEELERPVSEQGRLALLFVDLDGFKRINDVYSHAVGDEVLHTIAQRIRAAVRPDDVVARWGGDEFIVIATDLEDDTVALEIAGRIEEAVARPIAVRGETVYLTSSTGVAFNEPGDGISPAKLLEHVDAAMYRSKQEGRSRFFVFDESLRESSERVSMIEDIIRRAIQDDLLVVHYQPCVRVADRSIVAFEALIRLRTDGGELLAPDQFLTLASDIGMLVPLEREALRRVCRQTMEWNAQGSPLLASVNVSVRQLDDVADFEAYVTSVLDESGLPGTQLTLEITEHAFLDVSPETVEGMVRLVERGVSFSVDDFGTGYGSMTYLRAMPIQEIKVDRSFVQYTPGERAASAIVRAHAILAQELRVRCVAEGVETPQQHQFLLATGIEFAQGYYYERPLPAESFSELLGLPAGAVGSLG